MTSRWATRGGENQPLTISHMLHGTGYIYLHECLPFLHDKQIVGNNTPYQHPPMGGVSTHKGLLNGTQTPPFPFGHPERTGGFQVSKSHRYRGLRIHQSHNFASAQVVVPRRGKVDQWASNLPNGPLNYPFLQGEIKLRLVATQIYICLGKFSPRTLLLGKMKPFFDEHIFSNGLVQPPNRHLVVIFYDKKQRRQKLPTSHGSQKGLGRLQSRSDEPFRCMSRKLHQFLKTP